MPALVCLSPVLADLSFPRFPEELAVVAQALGELADLADRGIVRIVTTPIFRELLEIYCWNQPSGLKGDIYRFLNQLVLTGGERLVSINVDLVANYQAHPVPSGCDESEAYVQGWADDLGRLLVIHDDSAQDVYFIGVACERAFSGGELNVYSGNIPSRSFPLVSPQTCDCNCEARLLVDAYIFDVPQAIAAGNVSFADAKKNAHVIGASGVRQPHGGSHFKVQFPGNRSWPLDANYDPVVPQYLKELTAITGYPLPVIKYALTQGQLPPRQFRIRPEYLAN
jgi:hypothetical protein